MKLSLNLYLRLSLFIASIGVGLNAQEQYWTVDSSFAPAIEGTTTPGSNSIVSYPGGKLLAYSNYSIVNGVTIASHFNRLNTDGSLDSSFHGPNESFPLRVYADGKILVTTSTNGSPLLQIQRLLADGSLDSSFTATTINGTYATSTTLLADGRTLLWGDFTTVNGISRTGLVILSATGAIDTSFTSPLTYNNTSSIAQVAQTADGHILVAGRLYREGSSTQLKIVRLNLNGSIDPSFDASGVNFSYGPSQLYPRANGSVIVVDGPYKLIRLTSTGASDPSFMLSLVGSVLGFGPERSDKKIFYTTSTYVNSVSSRQLRLMNSDGSDDPTFPSVTTPDSNDYGVVAPVLSDDGSFFEGPLTVERYTAHLVISHVLLNGEIDPAYNPRFSRNATINAYGLQTDGKHLLAGSFDHVNNIPLTAPYDVVRLNTDGTLDSTFSCSLPASVSRFGFQPGGKIIVEGLFPDGGGGYNRVMRLNVNGSVDATFPPITQAYDSLAIDNAGYIYVFTEEPKFRRYTPEGQIDNTFQVLGADRITKIAPLSDGAVLTIADTTYSNSKLIRFLHDGSLALDFFGQLNSNRVAALAPLPDGNAVVVEENNSVQSNYTIARIKPDGTRDYAYNTGYSSSDPALYDHTIQLAVVGSVLDLYQKANSVADAPISMDFYSGPFLNIRLKANGELFINEVGISGADFLKYKRTNSTSPLQHPEPAILFFHPLNQVLQTGSIYSSPVVFVQGLGPFTYQWLKNGVAISDDDLRGGYGTDSQVLFIQSALVSDSGAYSVRITNAYGTATSAADFLTVGNPPPVITTQPLSSTVSAGATVTFAPVVGVGATPTYQWQKNGINIVGATTLTLALTNVKAADAGIYSLVATNNFGSTTSTPAVLTLISRTGNSAHLLGDFDGNGKADLVWTNVATGERSMWFLNGNTMSGGASLGVVSVDWVVSATVDFDGDGKADIFWTNTLTGDRAIWLMNGSTMRSNTFMGTVPPDWVISGTGDFNGDGKADLVWTNVTTGDRAMWLMNGSTVLGGGYLGTVPIAWTISGVGDFNGDGKADLVWSNTVTGEHSMWFQNGSTTIAGATLNTIPVAWVISGVGDFNGDGKADIFLTNTVSGDRVIWLMNGSTITTNAFMGTVPIEWTISGTGDFNGDKKKDLFWTNTANGDRAMWLLNGATVTGGGYMGTVPVEWKVD